MDVEINANESFITGVPEKRERYKDIKELKNVTYYMVDDKKKDGPTTMKDIGIGNHLVNLMSKCQSISSLESPKNLMKLSKVA